MSKDTKNKKNPLLEVDEQTIEKNDSEEVLEEEVDGSPEEGEVSEEETTPLQEDSKKEKPIENTNMALMSDAQKTKHITDNEEQVMFMIPLAQGENPGATHECFINGQKYIVRKGAMSKLPKSVVNILANHYNVTLNAGNDMLIDGDIEKEKALG